MTFYKQALKIWGCSCQSWPGVSVRHTLLSKQCCDTLAPLTSNMRKTLRNGIAVEMHTHSDGPVKQHHLNNCTIDYNLAYLYSISNFQTNMPFNTIISLDQFI